MFWPQFFEVLDSSIAADFFMFMLAALVYLLFKGSWATTKRPAEPPVTKSPASPSLATKKIAEIALRADVTKRTGSDAECLELLMSLPTEGLIPTELATKLLLLLCKVGPPESLSRLSPLLAPLAGRIQAASLEAAAEALRSQCPKLVHIAKLLSITKSEKALRILARGHAHDKLGLRALVEEVLASECAPSLLEGLAAICSTSHEEALAQRLMERASACTSSVTARASERKADGASMARHARFISQYGRAGNFNEAVAAFNRACQTGTPTVLLHNCFLDACILCSETQAAMDQFAKLKALGQVDVVSYNTMMKGNLAKNDYVAVLQLFSEMERSERGERRGIAPDRLTYQCVLNALSPKEDRKAIWDLIRQMLRQGIRVDHVMCSMLLKTIQLPSHSDDMRFIMTLMKDCEIPPDEWLINSMLEACLRTQSQALITDWLQLVDLECLSFADSKSDNSRAAAMMIRALGRLGDVDQIWKLWNGMETHEVKTTGTTLSYMFEALFMNKKYDEAAALLDRLWEDERKRPCVNTVTCAMLMKHFAAAKQPRYLHRLYQQMRKYKEPVNSVVFNTLLNGLVRCDLLEQVEQVLLDMSTSDQPVKPDLITFSTIIKGFCQAGDLDKGLALMRSMQSSLAIFPDEVLYNSLLDGCTRQQRLVEAMQLMDEMQQAGVTPSNHTLSIVTKLLGRMKRLDQAFAMTEEICKKYDFRPNTCTFTCLMQACFQNRQLQRGLALHDKMLRSGDCLPDEKTYGVMARGCMQAGNGAKLLDVLRCALKMEPSSLMALPARQSLSHELLKEAFAKLKDLGFSEEAKMMAGELGLEGGEEKLSPERRRRLRGQ